MPATIALLILAAMLLLGAWGWHGGRRMHARFEALGEVRGLTREQVIAAVGEPTGIERVIHGITALEWQKGRYRAVLGFKDGVCVGPFGQGLE